MKRVVLLSVWVIHLLTLSVMSSATSPDDFLKVGVGARAIGMGKSLTAMTQDTFAQHWNPAALALVQDREVVVMGAKTLGVVDTLYTGYSMSVLPGVGVAVGYVNSGVGGFKQTSLEGVDSGNRFSFEGTAFMGSLGTILPWMPYTTMGITVRQVSQSLGTSSGSGMTSTVGILKALSSEMRLGLVANNIFQSELDWGLGVKDPFEKSYRVGWGWMPDAWVVTTEWTYRPEVEAHQYSGGVEYHLDFSRTTQVAIRGGLDSLKGYSLGLGVVLDKFTLDYAYTQTSEDYIDNAHYISFKTIF